MTDFLSILIEKVASEPDRSEPTFAGLYRYFLKVYKNDATAAKDAMAQYLSGHMPQAVVADLDFFRVNNEFDATVTDQISASFNDELKTDDGTVETVVENLSPHAEP